LVTISNFHKYLQKALIFIGVFCFFLSCSYDQDSSIISIQQGKIKGIDQNDGTIKYFGIPYAKAPIGDHRWKEPLPHDGWEGTFLAQSHGKACMQPLELLTPDGKLTGNNGFYDLIIEKSGLDISSDDSQINAGFNRFTYDDMSEDCLFLNVVVPKGGSAKKPVMFWIHGGASRWGSGHESNYTSQYIPTEGDVIVVSINYRLGVFAWLAHPELSKESKNNVSGNYGTLDQIAALKWVKENISNFGGDPNNVTIFGESAGGQAVTSLMISPLSRGLFHKAIAQSGTGLPNVLTDIREDKGNLVSAESKGIKLAEYFLGENSNIKNLRELPALDIVSIDEFQLDQDLIMLTNQIVDGYVFPESIKDAFLNKNVHDLPFMVGFNGDEGTSLFPLIIDQKTFNLFGEFWPESLWAFVNPDPSSFQGPKGMKDFALSLDDNFYDAATDFWGFLFFGAPSYFIAKQHSLSGNPTYLYQFDKKPSIPNDYLGATHALELGYLFNKGGLFGIDGSYDDSDIKLAQQMRSDWIDFAKEGSISNADTFNNKESIARIYDDVITDRIIEHHEFYKSYSAFWENLQ
tara:strand:- start:3721 stop:5445 length:1725 start_codon:yes stop_codon:yes gene_type:complete